MGKNFRRGRKKGGRIRKKGFKASRYKTKKRLVAAVKRVINTSSELRYVVDDVNEQWATADVATVTAFPEDNVVTQGTGNSNITGNKYFLKSILIDTWFELTSNNSDLANAQDVPVNLRVAYVIGRRNIDENDVVAAIGDWTAGGYVTRPDPRYIKILYDHTYEFGWNNAPGISIPLATNFVLPAPNGGKWRYHHKHWLKFNRQIIIDGGTLAVQSKRVYLVIMPGQNMGLQFIVNWNGQIIMSYRDM